MRNSLDLYQGPLGVTDLDQLFERVLRNPFSVLGDLRSTERPTNQWANLAFDSHETDDAYLLSVDVPGVRKEDLKIELNERVLTISGERRHEAKGSRFFGRFERSFAIPSSVDVDHIEASMEDGVLKLALPKSAQAKPRTIAIEAGKAPGGFFSKFLGHKEAASKEVKDVKDVH